MTTPDLPDNHPSEGAVFLANMLYVPPQVVQAALNLGGYVILDHPTYKAMAERQLHLAEAEVPDDDT
jgi:hypothetical protein